MIVMSKQSGLSSVLAAAASFVVIGMVALGTPAQAQSEEDLAAAPGSFVSTMAVPAIEKIAYAAHSQGSERQPASFVYSEEDLAAPQGSFVSTMPVPGEKSGKVHVSALSENDAVAYDDLAQATLREAVAAALE
jgi:hypothetical protein